MEDERQQSNSGTADDDDPNALNRWKQVVVWLNQLKRKRKRKSRKNALWYHHHQCREELRVLDHVFRLHNVAQGPDQ